MTIADIKHFLIGNYKYHFDKEPHIVAQAEERAEKCRECLVNGRCVVCGCKTPEMFYAPNKHCPKGKWKNMLDKTAFELKMKLRTIKVNGEAGEETYSVLRIEPKWVKEGKMRLDYTVIDNGETKVIPIEGDTVSVAKEEQIELVEVPVEKEELAISVAFAIKSSIGNVPIRIDKDTLSLKLY